jgi:CRP-like cAMP-binding protein
MEIRDFDVPRYLSVLPLFSDLSATELEKVATGCELRRLARGDVIFRVGDPCEEFHVTVTGQIKLYVLSPNGQEKVIELIGPGGSFGEALMFTNKPYIINGQALTQTLLLTVKKSAVIEEVERDSRFAMRMLAGTSRRLHALVRDVEAYALQSGVQRVIGYLLRDRDEDDAPASDEITVTLPVSKATVASRLSLTPEYFSRVLHDLESAGLVVIDKRDVRIPDVRRLARYPES